MAETIADLRIEHSNHTYWLKLRVEEQAATIKDLMGPVAHPVNFRRKGQQFYFTLGEKDIPLTYDEVGKTYPEQYTGVDFSIFQLTLNEIQAIQKCSAELAEQLDLWTSCPKCEYDALTWEFSKREFKKILAWWALFEDEKKLIQHLYDYKYDHQYRSQCENKKREQQAAQKKTFPVRKTYVYLMKDEQTCFHKIGQSKNPKARESTLFSEKPSISLIAAWYTEGKDEKLLHDKFISKQVRGEWFDLSEDDVNEVYEYFSDRPQYEVVVNE